MADHPWTPALKEITAVWKEVQDWRENDVPSRSVQEIVDAHGGFGFRAFVSTVECTMDMLETLTGNQFRYDPDTGEDLDA